MLNKNCKTINYSCGNLNYFCGVVVIRKIGRLQNRGFTKIQPTVGCEYTKYCRCHFFFLDLQFSLYVPVKGASTSASSSSSLRGCTGCLFNFIPENNLVVVIFSTSFFRAHCLQVTTERQPPHIRPTSLVGPQVEIKS